MMNKNNFPWKYEQNYKQLAPNLTLMLSELNWPHWKTVTPKRRELLGLKVRKCYIMYDTQQCFN